MKGQLRRSTWCIAVALCLSLASSIDRAQDRQATLEVAAGLNGFVKAGRWVPVRVEVDHPGGIASADLQVTWGDATMTRPVVFGSSGVRRFEFFIRSADAGSLVRVTLRGPAGEVVADRPVTVLAQSVPVTLCVTEVDGWLEGAARCTMSLTPQQLPGSVRGYEMVDEVLTASTLRGMPEMARVALERGDSVRALESAGDLSLTPQVTRPLVTRGLAGTSKPAVKMFAGGYIAILLLMGIAVGTARIAPFWVWVAFALVLVAAGATALALGHAGPGSKIVVHYTALLQQIPGTNGSLVTLRGVAEFPSDENVHLRLPLEDAVVEAAAASGRAPQAIDDAGYPTLTGRYGFGTRQAFGAEAVTDTQWLTVLEEGETVHVVNRTDDTLHQCRFGYGMSVIEVGDLAANARVSATRVGNVDGPLFMCASPVPALEFTERSRAVEMVGTTTVAVYRDRRVERSRSEAPND